MTEAKQKDWLDNILNQLNNIDTKKDMLETLDAVKANETVVGVVNDENTKKLFILSCKYHDDAITLRNSSIPDNIEDFLIEINYKMKVANILKTMFWFSVEAKFGDDAKKNNIGLRENWTIVTIENKEEELDLLGTLLGCGITIGIIGHHRGCRH